MGKQVQRRHLCLHRMLLFSAWDSIRALGMSPEELEQAQSFHWLPEALPDLPGRPPAGGDSALR
jgi:hypothetical protein